MTTIFRAAIAKCTISGLAILLLAACAGAPATATPVPATAAPPPATATRPSAAASPTAAPAPTAAQAAALRTSPPGLPEAQMPYWISWREGPHANTYGLEKGPNTFCARCHAPANYDVASKVDPAPNCVSCKFATDTQVRIAEHNRFVPESEWKSIGCDVCHRVENGAVVKGLAWRDPASGQYQAVASATDLCEKCHTDTETLRHKVDLGQVTHRGFTCVSCHDPHTAQASCTAAACHAAVAQGSAPAASGTAVPAAPGHHDAAHAEVACYACHDASGTQVGPVKETGVWTTWVTTELLGRKTTSAGISHNLQRQVDCSRCHFAGNGWGLSVIAKPTP